jgi:dephospho-CoA kinase
VVVTGVSGSGKSSLAFFHQMGIPDVDESDAIPLLGTKVAVRITSLCCIETFYGAHP